MRVVSLFSGAGGLDLGLIWAGHEVIWANDIYADAVQTYRMNIGDHIELRDICEIDTSEIPDCDLVVGGFPCQGFSVANWGRSTDDPRNQLYKQFVRVISEKKPSYFLAENVKGLASLGKGVILKNIISDFEKSGYSVKYAIVNCADYGVPQFRKRILILGQRLDVSHQITFPPIPTHADPTLASDCDLLPWLSSGAVLSHLPEPDSVNNIPNHECSKYKLRFNGHIGHRFVDPDRPAPTVTARGDERGGVVVIHHPGNHRRMTARELATIQSFPENFVFHGTKTSAYRQIGNAVPPLLGRAIGLMLMSDQIQSENKSVRAA